MNLYHVTKFSPYFPFTVYCFYTKISSFMPALSIRIVLDCFYLLIFYSEKFSTDVCRLPYAVNVNLNLSNNNFWPLLHVPDTDDVKQKNKNHKTIPWTENKQVFCLTSSVSSTRNFEPIFIPPGAGVIQSTYFTIPYNSLTLSSVLHAMLLYKNPPPSLNMNPIQVYASPAHQQS